MSAWFDRNKHRYPANWTEIATAIKDAAGWRCEACDAPHGPSPHVLTVHHLNHDVDNPEAALVALCQKCHLQLGPQIYTKQQAIEKLRRRHELERAQLVLL